MSMESTARTPLPYRLVRPWVSTIVMFSMPIKLGFRGRRVVSRKTDLWGHPYGRAERPVPAVRSKTHPCLPLGSAELAHRGPRCRTRPVTSWRDHAADQATTAGGPRRPHRPADLRAYRGGVPTGQRPPCRGQLPHHDADGRLLLLLWAGRVPALGQR